MSSFVGLVPVIRIQVRNLLLGLEYPSQGSVEAIVDTGYEGFVALPTSAFNELSLGKLKTLRRRVELADGETIQSRVAYGTVQLVDINHEIDGPLETIAGLRGILVGTRLLSDFKVTLDYCLRAASMEFCA